MSNARRVARNTLANWAGLVANTLILLLLTPYVLGVLGKERFGVYVVAQQALIFVNLLTLGMRAGMNRFTARDVFAEDAERLNHTLSTVFLFHVGIGVVGLLIFAGLGLVAPSFFGIQRDFVRETVLLFAAVGLNFLLDLIGFTYRGLLVGHQRFDLLNVGMILQSLIRAGFVVAIFTLGWGTLGGFAVAVTASYCIALGYFWFVSHRIQPTLKIRLRGVTRESFREVLGFGVWNGIVQFGNVVTFAMPPLVVGRVLGADQIVFFSIPFMLADRLRMVVVGMANTLAPIAAGTLVSGDRDQFRSLIVTGTLAAATMCLPVGAILLVFCKPFLVLWMGDEFAWSWVVYGIVMIAMFGRITQAPTLHVLLGGGRIRGLAYVQLLTAVATVVLMIVLVTHTTWHVIAVAVGVTVPLFLSHTVFLPWYAARQMSLSLPHYLLRSYLPPLLATLPGVLLALLLNRVWPPTTWSILIVEGAASLGVSTVTAWSTCLDQSIRERLMRKVGMFFHA